MALLAAKTRCLRPVLTLDVIDHSALFPSQQRGDHKTNAFAAPRWREGENVFGTIVTEVIQSVSAFRTPAADVDAVFGCEQPGIAHIVLVGPLRGAMEVLSILREFACSAVREDEENTDTQETPCEHDHFALEERPANPLILRRAIAPPPRNPREGLVDAARFRPQNRCAQCSLILEPGRDVLRRYEVHDKEQKTSEGCRSPVIAAEISGFTRNTVEFRLFLPHGSGSLAVAVLHSCPLPEFADSAFGVGVIDTHAFANLRLAIEHVLRVSNARAARLALDNMMLGLTNDGTPIAAALGLRGECLCRIPEELCGD